MRTMLAACALAATFVAPAFADEAAKKGTDADDAFMTGIRKLGVMSGEAFACSSEVDKPRVGQGAIDLATQVSLHFGLQAAFVYSGSFGYGTGHDFDHAACPQVRVNLRSRGARHGGRGRRTGARHGPALRSLPATYCRVGHTKPPQPDGAALCRPDRPDLAA